MPNLEVTGAWQDWIVNDDLVSEGDDGSFIFKRKAPTSDLKSGPPPTRKSTNLPAPRTAAPAPHSGARIRIMSSTADLAAELMAVQRTLPSWKSAQMESMDWEGTAEENIK
ncbi:hypothetical protein BJV74DRAFT_920650 [Russula compacta]|nr:hypothetical protein BJV74DRAFT_920650 [Russula compacta]